MRATNEQRLKELEDKAKDAEENLGETEVRDALHARAEYLGRIGDREAAAKAYAETEEKTASGGAKADMVFSQIRCVCEGLAGIGGGVGRCVAQCFGGEAGSWSGACAEWAGAAAENAGRRQGKVNFFL